MLGENDEGVFLALFNWSDDILGIQLSKLPTSKIESVNYIEIPVLNADKNTLNIKLQGCISVIFKLGTWADFNIIIKQIVYDFNND